MISLAHLCNYITTSTGYVCKEAPELLPEETELEINETSIFVDYGSFLAPSNDAAIEYDSASELSSELIFIITVDINAHITEYPNVLYNVYKALQHYKPISTIDNIRSFTFLNGDFIKSNGRRICKMNWSFTFDRIIY